MGLANLKYKKWITQQIIPKLSDTETDNFNEHFSIEYTHDSTAIEGNTISLVGTRMILVDGIVPAETTLRELDEVRDHADAWAYVKQCVKDKVVLDEEKIKDIHQYVIRRNGVGGIYRNIPVYIRGSQYVPPAPEKVWNLMGNFGYCLTHDTFESAIEKAAWAHAELVKIHPFTDGNGRTGRLIMNYTLMEDGFLPTSIKKDTTQKYFRTLEHYEMTDDLKPFINLLIQHEEKTLDDFLAMYHQHIDLEQIRLESPVIAKVAEQYCPATQNKGLDHQ